MDLNATGTGRVLYSARRTVSISVETDGSVLVRAPHGFPEERVRALLSERAAWIDRHRARALERLERWQTLAPLTGEQRAQLKRETAALLRERLPVLAARIGVRFTGFSVRFQRTRFGSCSARGHLSFHASLGRMPREVAEYVMIHELCHLLHMDHSAAFWATVERFAPAYREARRHLRDEGYLYLDRPSSSQV